MEENLKKLFFHEKNLNGYKYVFHLLKYSDAQRIELSSRIQAVGGVKYYNCKYKRKIMVFYFDLFLESHFFFRL